MAEKREIKLYSLETVSPDLQAHEAALAEIQNRIEDVERNYQAEVEKIESNFDLFANENHKTYERYEGDFTKVLEIIDHEYESLFHALDEDFLAHRDKLEKQLGDEDEGYQRILKSFEDLKNDAFSTYQNMCRNSESGVNKETEIHQKFVDEKNAEFEAIKNQYSLINNQQYDTLLWTMEKAKNALGQLAKQLNEKAFSDTKFMNSQVLEILENLRDTKNKITALFKTTTLGYSNKKNRISELSEIRQIPYSEINQSLIDQYVRQIASVNQKKLDFDKLVNEDYLRSSLIVGRKIVEADEKKDKRSAQRFILQYGIIKAKSHYLLNRNQKLSDLLISKYQNEIRKIKVDSFRRVEEIKLAYSLPAQFFQNSIILYSNYAFYVSESLDEIDNMLSDFLRYNQNVTQTFVDYLKSSAKTFEDYKINCLVTVNNVTAKMTDLITAVDRYSRDIVSLESNNRLEIGEVKKQMENADITGDYQKYMAQLAHDREIADFQHSLNIKKHMSFSDGEAGLLVLQREVTEKNKHKQIDEALAKHERLLNNLEKDIHDQAYDRELALIEARHRRDLALVDLEEKRTRENELFGVRNQKSELSRTIGQQLEKVESHKAAGSEFVVEYVHHAQRLIDLKKDETFRNQEYLLSSKAPKAYAYLLEEQRGGLLDQLEYRSARQSEPHRKAVEYFDCLLFTTRKNIEKRIGKSLDNLKHLLVNLSPANAPLQAEALSIEHYYRYEILGVVNGCRETVSSLISPEQNAPLFQKAEKLFDDDFKRVAILTTSAEQNSLMNVKSAIGLKKTLLSFYVEMILLLEGFLSHIRLILDELELCLIEKDILILKKNESDLQAKKKIINAEFDAAVAKAARRKTPADISVALVDEHSKEVEKTIADRVYQLNQAYLKEVAEQEAQLRRMDRQLQDENAKNESLKDDTLKKNQKTAAEKKLELEADYRRHISAYEALKKKNYSAAVAANLHTETELAQRQKQRGEALVSMNKSVEAFPKKNDLFVLNLQTEKEQFLKERKLALTRELAHIEEQKFVSRPAFLTRMGQIRERLPQDYVELYKQIADSQTKLVQEFQITNDQYAQEYEQFLKNQVEYDNILFNDQIILHPFEKFLVINDRLKVKTDEVVKDTQAKSGATQDAIKKQQVESEENQKRILNA